MAITVKELEILNRTRFHDWIRIKMHHGLWARAFDEYNEDHPKDRPLGLHCRSCYMKVYKHLKTKYDASVLNN